MDDDPLDDMHTCLPLDTIAESYIKINFMNIIVLVRTLLEVKEKAVKFDQFPENSTSNSILSIKIKDVSYLQINIAS